MTGYAMPMFYGGGYMIGMHALWWLFWLVLIVGFLFYGRGRAPHQRHLSRETAHESLRRRLASGEITPADYEERKALLDRDSDRPG